MIPFPLHLCHILRFTDTLTIFGVSNFDSGNSDKEVWDQIKAENKKSSKQDVYVLDLLQDSMLAQRLGTANTKRRQHLIARNT